ncbi:MAG: type II 3-dehydroquinate dehydratase [Gammaproteobacteria bacterium]
MMKILLIQGPNLHYLGKREPEIYGKTTAAELDALLQQHAVDHQYQLEIFYTNIEGEAVNRIYQGLEDGVQGIVMNPAAFGFNGYAIKDCLEAVKLPYIEVHISNIVKRKRESILAEVANGVIFGFGIDGYFLALQGLLRLLKAI